MSGPALLIVDVQKAIDHPSWGADRNNPDAEGNIARLLSFWRDQRWPLFHIRHVSRDPKSTYRPRQNGAEFKPQAAPLEGEPIIDKSTNSAFIGTALESELRSAEISTLIITGVTTNNSVEATARMAGNLGFESYVIADATATFGRYDFAGTWRTAEEVHAMSLANINGEYAIVLTTEQLLEKFQARG
jgi:nicotinamidase-related amidase